MLGPLFAAALAVLPATNEPARVEVEAAAQLDARTIIPPHSSDDGLWLAGEGSLGATLYSRRLIDDDAAPALQPFLQRSWSLHVDGGGGGGQARYPLPVPNLTAPAAGFVDYRSDLADGRADLAAESYVGRWAYLGASLGVLYQSWKPSPHSISIGGFFPTWQITPATAAKLDSNELSLPVKLTIGLRVRDVLLTAGWSVTPYRLYDGDFRVRFWGGAFAAARLVVGRFVDLSARVEVLDRGALATADATIWLRRRIGLSAGVTGGHGGFIDYNAVYDRAGGQLGISGWLSPSLGATLAYAVTWQSPMALPGVGVFMQDLSTVAHTLTLTLTTRPTLARR